MPSSSLTSVKLESDHHGAMLGESKPELRIKFLPLESTSFASSMNVGVLAGVELEMLKVNFGFAPIVTGIEQVFQALEAVQRRFAITLDQLPS